MEPEPDPVDLSILDPKRDAVGFERTASRIVQRALELRRFRRAVIRRGVTAVVVAAAAGLALWLSAPRREPVARSAEGILGWAVRDANPDEVLGLGGPYAQ